MSRIELVADDDGRGGVTVLVEGHPQSHVSPADPQHLAFEYVEHIACVIDTLPPGPLAVTHVGGGGLTLARYVHTVRPGSPQIVLEPDAELTEVVRRELPLPRRHRVRIRPVDGLTGVTALADGRADVVVLDAYAGGRVPAELTTVEFLAQVVRVLRPGGVALLNLADEPGLRFVARVAAAAGPAGLRPLALVATHEVLKGKRFGNTVLVACADLQGREGEPDVEEIRRRVARSPFPTGVRHGAELGRMVQSARPSTVDDPATSPVPPRPGSWRRP